ncbi:autotransporter domain-containing protein [Phycisphaerales bacterium AB-hyl4]|uniref:Autotransporter domain-containing protein n=1 Tax=Natronomicrosphaera hydrolytica TaxID=3242702 RepID=A0ABV4U0J4_9BACT
MDGHTRITRAGRLLVLLTSLVTAGSALASPIVVTNTHDAGAGSFRDAIAQANASGSASTIQFDASLAGQTLALDSALPLIASDLVVEGGAGLTISGQGQHRIFFVDQGNVTIHNLNLVDGLAQGGRGGDGANSGAGGGGMGAGGALFVNEHAHVTLSNVTLTDNHARGGDGGNAFGGGGAPQGGGGGGGLGGDGGPGGGTAGGGGGGQGAAGGSGVSTTGGGGGGVTNPGDNGGSGGGPGGDGGSEGQQGSPGQTHGGGGGGGGDGSGTSGGAAGQGGDFGGGGGGGINRSGGDGGFGAGGGGRGVNFSAGPSPGTGGFGGGDGSNYQVGGGGGDAYGGAIFVREGGSLTIIDPNISGSGITAGQGGSGTIFSGSAGTTDGAGLYLMHNINAQIGVSENNALVFAEMISGPGGITKTGQGTLVLPTNFTYTGDTHINEGELHLTGSIAGDAFISSDAILSGDGIIAGSLTNAGILSPGNSIGTITIQGDYTHEAAATLRIEFNDAGNTPGVNNDLVDITGHATLEGGSVHVVAQPGDYTAGTQYTFLHAADGRTGTFDNITHENLSYLFTTELSYTADSARFAIVFNTPDYESLGRNRGERAVGRYLESRFTTATGDMVDLFQNLESLDDAGKQNAIQQLTGETIGSGATATLQTLARAQESAFNRIRPGAHIASDLDSPAFNAEVGQPLALAGSNVQPFFADPMAGQRDQPGRWMPWVQGFGEYGDVSGSRNATATGYDYWSGGMMVGIDREVDDHWLVGGRAAYARTRVNSDHDRHRHDIDHYQVGVHARYNEQAWYGLGSAFAGYQRYDSQRRIRFADYDRQGKAKYNGGHLGLAFEVGRKFQQDAWAFQPIAGVQYVYLRRAGFSESGAGSANLQVNAESTQSLRSSLGFNLSRSLYQQPDAHLMLHLRGRWVYEFLDDAGPVTARFADAVDAFTVESATVDRHTAVLGTGLGWQLNERTSLGVHYDATLNSHFVSHHGSVAMSFAW